MKLTKKIAGAPAAVKASVALTFATFFEKGIIILAVPIFTRLMSTAEYGEFSVFVSWIEVIGLLTSLCLSKGIYNNGLQEFKEDRDNLSFSFLVLSSISTVCVMAIVVGIACLYPSLMNLSPALLAIMFALFLFEPAYNLWRVRQRFEYRYKLQIIISCLLSFASTIVAIALVCIFRDQAVLARAFGMYAILIAAYIAFYLLLMIRAKGKLNLSYWKYALTFNLPLIPHYLSLYLLSHFDRIMIAGFLGDSYAAIYTLAYQLGSAASIVWSAVNASLIPYTYEKCAEKSFSDLSRTINAILAIYAVVCFALILFAPELMGLLAPSSYQESVNVVPPVVAGVFFSSLYYIFANVIYYYKKPRYVMVASCASAVLNIALNAVFIPRFGILAAAYSTIFCYFIQACIDYWAMRKVVKQPIYNMKFIILLTSSIFFVSVIGTLLYSNVAVRIALIAAIAVAAILFRKKLINTILKLKR